MSLANIHKRQFTWRPWPDIIGVLPALEGQTILDLGCGVGDLAAEFVARGARVIGIDMNEELLHEARSRRLTNAEFRLGDLRKPLDLGMTVDGLWCSFTAAYFPNLPAALSTWTTHLRPRGWLALTEIDDLFGHEPLDARTKLLLVAYARDALAAGRYDFHMGRKLGDHLDRAGFRVSKTLTLLDQELSFSGPAAADVVEAWRRRLDGMKLLHDFCGAEYERLQQDFLGSLTHPGHHSIAKVYCCMATIDAGPK